jgi:2-oxoglutarate ferredoxin oxidoreductase subunit alpha
MQELIGTKNIQLLTLQIADKYENTYLLALLVKLLGIDGTLVESEIRSVFEKKGEEVVMKNLEIVSSILAEYILPTGNSWNLTQQSEHYEFTYGNRLIALGAMDSGLEYYSAYPMTPASTILTEITAAKRIPFLQAEDEVAVINSAL